MTKWQAQGLTSPTTTDCFSLLTSRSGRSPYPDLEALDYPRERLFPGCGRLAYDSSKPDRKRGTVLRFKLLDTLSVTPAFRRFRVHVSP